MIGINNCEIVDRDNNKQYIENVARLVPYRHFQPSRSAVDIAIRAALPQPAAAELELKEEQQALLFVATPSPAMSKYKQLYTVKLRTAHYISYNLFDGDLLHG